MIMPCCGAALDNATILDPDGPTDARPKPGDATICIQCGMWNIYVAGDQARLFGPDDLLEFSDEQLHRLRRATHLIRAMRCAAVRR